MVNLLLDDFGVVADTDPCFFGLLRSLLFVRVLKRFLLLVTRDLVDLFDFVSIFSLFSAFSSFDSSSDFELVLLLDLGDADVRFPGVARVKVFLLFDVPSDFRLLDWEFVLEVSDTLFRFFVLMEFGLLSTLCFLKYIENSI